VFFAVMPGLVPGIHVLKGVLTKKAWMAGISPAMTPGEAHADARVAGSTRTG
jgi:hypothetical protein